VLTDQVVQYPIGIMAIAVRRRDLEMPAVGSEPKRAGIVYFRDAVTPALFQLQPELLPAEASHRHDQVACATKLRDITSAISG
jgi:hypothetical protein